MPKTPRFVVCVLLGNVQTKNCSKFTKQILSPETLSVILKKIKLEIKFSFRYNTLARPIFVFVPLQKEHSCYEAKSLVICVNLTDLEIKSCFPLVAPKDRNIPPLSHLALAGLSNTFSKQLLYYT